MLKFDRNFFLWAYTVSHNFLVLRSPMEYPDVDNYSLGKGDNIDIEFSAVSYLDLPTKLIKPSFRVLNHEVPEKFQEFIFSQKLKLIEIEAENGLFYIVSSGFQIGRNKWIETDRSVNPILKHDFLIWENY
jgi:hypothetical protein